MSALDGIFGPRDAASRVGTSVVFSTALSAVLLAAIALTEVGSPVKDRQFSADSSYLILLMDDLFFHRGRLADWFLAPHYYFFPDGLLSLFIIGAQRVGIAPFVSSVVLHGAYG